MKMVILNKYKVYHKSVKKDIFVQLKFICATGHDPVSRRYPDGIGGQPATRCDVFG